MTTSVFMIDFRLSTLLAISFYAVDVFAVIALSLYMHRVASPSAPEEIPRAPFRPSLEIDKNTPTTKTLRGIPKRFIITERLESGTYLLRSVPIDGKYIPTQASNAKKAPTRAGRAIDDETAKVALDIATVAAVNMTAVNFSVGTFIFASCPNNVDPSRHDAMKHENTVP